MVRRWSYLNTLNTRQFFFTTSQPKFLTMGHQKVTFKATTYYRKRLYSPLISKLTRRAFFRRKHLNNWLVYQNILSYWASEYLFFRRYSRSLLALAFYKNTYLMYNVLVFGKLMAPDLVGFESLVVTNLLQAVTHYCNFGARRLLPFLAQFRDVSWFYASAATSWEQVVKASTLKEESAYLVSDRSLTPSNGSRNLMAVLPSLFETFEKVILQKLVSVYQLCVLLTLVNVSRP